MSYQYLGWIAVFCAIILFGFLSTPMKVSCVRKADPMIIQIFMSPIITIGMSFPIIFTYKNLYFSYPGILGALLWVPVSCLSIFCVQLIGISLAQSIWSGV